MKYVSQHIVVLRKVDSSVVQRFCQVISDFLNVFLSEIAYITIVFNIQNGRVPKSQLTLAETQLHIEDKWVDRTLVNINRPLTLGVLVTILSGFTMTLEIMEAIMRYVDHLIVSAEHTLAQHGFAQSYQVQRNCYISVRLLDLLFGMCEEGSLLRDLRGKFLRTAYSCCSLRYLGLLKEWVEYGKLDDFHNEFFIQKTDVGSARVDEFKLDWEQDYRIRVWPNEEGEEIKLEPLIFEGLGQIILDSGKSARLAMYLKTFPLNTQVLNQPLSNTAVFPQVCQSLDDLLKEYYPDFETTNAKSNSPQKSKYKRPTFNSFLQVKDQNSSPEFNGISITVLPSQGKSLAEKLLASQSSVTLIPKPQKLNSAIIPSYSFSFDSGNSIQSKLVANKNPELQALAKLANLEIAFSKEANTPCILHKSLRTIYKKILRHSANVCFSNLGALLNLSFNIRLLMETLWSVFFLDRIHLAYESFQKILIKVDIEGVNESKETIKQFIKELVGKINPDNEQSFTLVKRYLAEEKKDKIYQLTKTNISIKYEPTYPLKIIFTEAAVQNYNKCFLLILHIEIARWNILSRFHFFKHFKMGLNSNPIATIGGGSITPMTKQKSMVPSKSTLTIPGTAKQSPTLPKRTMQRQSSAISIISAISSHKEEWEEAGEEFINYKEKNARKIYALIPKLMAAQREYLQILNAIDNFIRRTIIQTNIQEFIKCLDRKPGLVELAEAHREFITQIVDHSCLSDRGSKMLEIIYRCVEFSIEFGHQCKELEHSLSIDEEDILDHKIYDVYLKVRRGLFQTRRDIMILLEMLHKYHKKGIDFKMIELLTCINFNDFYLDYNGNPNEAISKTIN